MTSATSSGDGSGSCLCNQNWVCNALGLSDLVSDDFEDPPPSPEKPKAKKPNISLLVHANDLEPCL